MTYRAIGPKAHYLPMTFDRGEDVVFQVSAIGKIWAPCRVRIWDWEGKLWFIATDNMNCPVDINGNIYIFLPAAVTTALPEGKFRWDFYSLVDGEFRETIAGPLTVRWGIVLPSAPVRIDGFADSYWETDAFPYPGGPTLSWSFRAVGFRTAGSGRIDQTVWDASIDSAEVIPGGRVATREDIEVP